VVALRDSAIRGVRTDDLLCSRNARPSLDSARDPEPVEGQKTLVGSAQWKIHQPPSLRRERASVGGPFLVKCRSMAAHHASLGGGLQLTNLACGPGRYSGHVCATFTNYCREMGTLLSLHFPLGLTRPQRVVDESLRFLSQRRGDRFWIDSRPRARERRLDLSARAGRQ
jgi:hypothetical protein